MISMDKTAADLFAGIGIASLGFTRQEWQVKFAVDHSVAKQQMYEKQFGTRHSYAPIFRSLDLVRESIPVSLVRSGTLSKCLGKRVTTVDPVSLRLCSL